MPNTAGPRVLRHRVGDAWLEPGSERVEIRNPADLSQVVGIAPRGDSDVVEMAVDAAQVVLPAWSRLGGPARAEILFRAADLVRQRESAIARDLTREEGKTLAEATVEVRRAAAIVRYFAGRTFDRIGESYASAFPRTRIQTLREPLGVVAVITPWNFPIAIPAWKIAPAIAYGNAVIFKPASSTPLTAHHLVEAFIDAGLPAGVLNVVYAPGSAFDRLWIKGSGVAAVSFTGSASAGRELAAQAGQSGIKVQLELGGKNGVVVAPDADVGLAADAIVRGAFASAGQKCTSTSRVIAVDDVYESVAAEVHERVARLIPGDPLEPSTTLGPVINVAARDRIAGVVQAARDAGARVVYESAAPRKGAFAPAVVLDQVETSATVARDEIFGPVLALLRAHDVDEAIRIHNDVAYGLSGSIFTGSLAVADRFARTARVGVVHVNGETAGLEPHVPFGGMKASSSWSREQGRAAEEFYTQTKTVYWEGLSDAGPFDLW